MDLTIGWDFNLKTHREAAIKYIEPVNPRLVIGSPECRMSSTLQNLRVWGRRAEQELEEAKEHVRFVIKLYKMQIAAGRWFLHEHPVGATSWQMAEMVKLEKETGVTINVADQCMYGLKIRGEDGEGELPARKRTKFMTNSYWIAMELRDKCDGRHRQQHLINRRAKLAAKYPKRVCQAICAGLRNQIREPEQLKCLMSV